MFSTNSHRRAGRIVAALALGFSGIAATVGGIAITATNASAATPCVNQDFSVSDENAALSCVTDEQILMNNLAHFELANNLFLGVNGLLTVDGHYGPATSESVVGFQGFWKLGADGITGPQTWLELCNVNAEWGFEGVYWHNAGCAALQEGRHA